MEKKTIKILSDEEISKIETIGAKRIREIMEYSLFSEDEINLAKKKDGTFDAACVITKMIRGNSLVFCWIRLKEFKSEIRKYLDLLSDEFKEHVGAGYTFLSMCVDKNNRQWGGHINCDELFTIGNALGLCDFCIKNRLTWKLLPGGVPYIVILDKPKEFDEANLPLLQSLL